MNPRPSLAMLAALAATLAAPAFAQTATPVVATTSQSFTVPQSPCTAPKFPTKSEGTTQANYNKVVEKFNADYKAYGECIKKYVEDTKVWVKEVADAGNKAIDEYNKYNADLKEKLAEEKQ